MCAFYLSFVDLIINLNDSFNHLGQVLKLVHLANFIFNGILKAVIELGRNDITFLI
jgi:hypothetical protein